MIITPLDSWGKEEVEEKFCEIGKYAGCEWFDVHITVWSRSRSTVLP